MNLKKQCGRRANVEDLKRQWFYRFLQKTVLFHILGLGFILFYLGGMSFVTWGMVIERISILYENVYVGNKLYRICCN